MARNIKQVGENRYREEYGRYYDDFEVGDIYEHRPGRTVTQMDNIWFTLLTMNTHPLHFNDEFGESTEFDRCLVNSTLTFAIVNGMSVSDVSHKAIANLGWGEVELNAPVFHGDTLYAESEVVEKRESESREGQGLVTVETRAEKGTGEQVMEYTRTILVPLRAEEDHREN